MRRTDWFASPIYIYYQESEAQDLIPHLSTSFPAIYTYAELEVKISQLQLKINRAELQTDRPDVKVS